MVENFEKQIQEQVQVIENVQILTGLVVGETFEIELSSDYRKFLESFRQEQKEIQNNFLEIQSQFIES